MTDWPELVTTALLGTGRRPVPIGLPESWAGERTAEEADPAVRILDLAARHRAVRRAATRPVAVPDLAGFGPASRPPAPPSDRPPPPPPAAEVLSSLLIRPTPALINFWLRCAESAGCGIPARYWTRLARLAAHSTAYDRGLLGRVLGARGRWFWQQNPEWRRLAADADPARRHAQDTPRQAQGTAGPTPRPTAETVRARPKSIFDHPDPWPTDVVAAAYVVLGSGMLGRAARDYAAGVGARLPAELYASLGAAAEYYLQAPEASPALRRAVRESFVIVERAAYTRTRIEHAFRTSEESSVNFRRVEIPSV